jgi:aryl-alcohol dehydrogenase-like predicted oxidoreductase
VERSIEREHIPAAQELGIGICPWSPLAGGFLSGKYPRDDQNSAASGRLNVVKDSGNPVFEKFTERNWRILDVLVEVARSLDRSPAEIALNWATTQPGITSVILGATKASQLEKNLAALDFEIPAELRSQLDQVSALDPIHPYVFFGPYLRKMINGGVEVRAWGCHRE